MMLNMDQSSTLHKMSRTESGSGRVSGSRTNEGLKGSEVGTRSQDESEDQPSTTISYQELRRRKFFDRTTRSRRPDLNRRHATLIVPRKSITTVVETVVDVAGDDGSGGINYTAPRQLAADPPSPSTPEQLTVPAVPKFPTFSMPTVPTVPAYPFNTPSSQSVLSSPPSSPIPSDTSFTNTAIVTPSSSAESSSPSSETSDSFGTPTPTAAASTISVSYSNSTVATGTVTNLTASTGLISLSDQTTFSTRTSGSTPESPPGGTVPGAAGAAATLSATGTAPVSVVTSSSTSDPGTGSGGLTGPNTPQVVGGVVGGIAGLAVILLVLLFLLRRYRRQLQDRGELLDNDGSPREITTTMSMRSSHTPLVAAVAAPFKKMRPASSHTTGTAETTTSDRGFQRVAGRKIEPVLTSGGDGYGGNYGAFEKESGMNLNKETQAPSSSHPEAQPLVGTSFYHRDTLDFTARYGSGISTPTPAVPAARFASASDHRDFANTNEDKYNRRPSPDIITAVMRPSPARSPVTTSASPNQLAPQRPRPTMSSDAPPTPTLPARFIPDGVGRSLISQDGSRGSKFTESI